MTISKNGRVVALFILSAILIASILLLIAYKRNFNTVDSVPVVFTEEQFSSIQIGMTRDEVIHILGKNPGSYVQLRGYDLQDQYGWEDCVWWESDRFAIGIHFDADNKVIEKRKRIRIVTSD
jgi:hypothetical protein